MVAESTAVPPKRYRATCIAEFYCGGRTYRAGEEIEVAYEDIRRLAEAGLIGGFRPVRVETATVNAPENTARNYRGKGR